MMRDYVKGMPVPGNYLNLVSTVMKNSLEYVDGQINKGYICQTEQREFIDIMQKTRIVFFLIQAYYNT